MRPLIAVTLLLALGAGPATSALPIKVKGRSLARVHLDAGRTEGLKVGDRLRVMTGEKTVAEIEVVYLDDNTAYCKVLSQKRPVGIGDVAVPVVRVSVPPAASPQAAKAVAQEPASAPPSPVAGQSQQPATASAPPAPAPQATAAATSPPLTPRVAAAGPSAPSSGPPAAASKAPAAGAWSSSAPVPSMPAPVAAAATPTAAAAGASSPAALTPSDTAPSASVSGVPAVPPVAATASAPAPAPAAAAGPSGASTAAASSSTAPRPATPLTPPAAAAKAPALAASSPATAVPPAPTSAPLALAAMNVRVASSSPQALTAAFTAASAAGSPVAEKAAASAKPSPAPAVVAPAPASGRGFRVKYRSAANVYLEGGRAEGLNAGDRLRIVAGETTVAQIEAVYVAEMSASCKVLSETRPIRTGDVAWPVAGPSSVKAAATGDGKPTASAPVAVASASVAPAAEDVARKRPSRAPWARVRGGASLGYYRSWDKTASALDFEQRTGRLDLGLDDIAGQPLSFTLRARSRQDIRARTLSTRTPKHERSDRLYELALRYEPASDRLGVEAGRIGIYRFVGIGYLDGALAHFRPRPGIQLGAFGGRQAEIDGYELDESVQKFGGFLRLAPGGRYAVGGYDVVLAYVRENAESDVSREYFSLESSFGSGSRWSLFQRAELDLNRGWRQEISGKSYQFSNISFSGNLRLTPSSWAFVSYDGRRNYRYYRNRLVPEEVFDDLLHQGLRAGLNVAKPGGFGASAGLGMSLKEGDPHHPELDLANAYSFNAGLRHANLFSSGVSIGLDGSGFTNGYAEGGLLSARLGWRFGPGHLLDLSYGYSLYRVTETEEERTTRWLRFVGRAELGRRVYLLGDIEYDAGDDLEGPRAFLELGFVF